MTETQQTDAEVIAEVQALAGCVHEWEWDAFGDDDLDLYACKVCDKTLFRLCEEHLPSPAPDCSTLDGALDASEALLPKQFEVFVLAEFVGFSPNGKTHFRELLKLRKVVERPKNRAAEVCRFILHGRAL